ncbi:MAG: Calcium/calmodulin-dependent protein kinase type II subunit gamma, partial [Paramarteilia canceri]
GAFAVVHECLRKDDSQVFAVKIISKPSISKKDIQKVQNEIEINKKVNHENT